MSERVSITMTSLLVIITLYLHLGSVISHDLEKRGHAAFDYDPHSPFGVYRWANIYPECGTMDQSPVNIDTRRVRYGVPFKCPHVLHYKSIAGTLTNNGDTTTFVPTEDEAVKMANVPYNNDTYIMHSFHVHFGGSKSMFQGAPSRLMEGSEHEVNGIRYSGEFHFVFYNSRFSSLEEAFGEPGGVTVVARFVQRVQQLAPEAQHLSDFLENNIPAVYAIDSTIRTTIDFTMFADHECDFYTYFGSTTTPVCHPNIRWVILRKPISVTNRAWDLFRHVDLNGDSLGRYGNHRPVQPLNGRIIEANFVENFEEGDDADD